MGRIGDILTRCAGGAAVLLAIAASVTVLVAITAPAARADDFLPHPAGATWQYRWTDSTYNRSGTVENVTVATRARCGWQLAWTGVISEPTGGGQGSTLTPDTGKMCFRDQSYGLLNTNWTSSPPPASEPTLCAASGSRPCANSLGSVLYDVIWGGRSPVLSEPLLQGLRWRSKGGLNGTVMSTNAYVGLQRVSVPAFSHGVTAVVVRSVIAQRGTPGDTYGSGTRTIWWVRGVGPVKLTFDHVDGSVTSAAMTATNLKALPARPDQNYFPLRPGMAGTYRWVNAQHLPRPEIERAAVVAVVNRSARIAVRSVSGPLRAAGEYVFADDVTGLRTSFASNVAATPVTFPHLGRNRLFFTPLDFVAYGLNPVLPAYPVPGTVLRSGNPRDRRMSGVAGITRVVGVRSVTVPAGRFRALEVRSVLTRRGSAFGSGVRTEWFAPGRGLVKLVFAHRDGSTSIITLIR